MKRAICVLLLSSIWMSMSTSASASFIIKLDQNINPTTQTVVRDNTALPYLTATFSTFATDTVRLELDASNLIASEYVFVWLFNSATAIQSITQITYPGVTFTETGVSKSWKYSADSEDGGTQIKAGNFDLSMTFAVSNSDTRLDGTNAKTYVFELKGTGLTEMSFNALSANKPNPAGSLGGWLSAADIRGISTTDPQNLSGDGSGSVGGKLGTITTQGDIVPEPTSLALAGFAGIGMAVGAIRRRWQQKQAD